MTVVVFILFSFMLFLILLISNFLYIGDSINKNIIICIQLYGNDIPLTLTQKSVNGSIQYIAGININATKTIFLLPFINKLAIIAADIPGKKSNPKKIKGFPNIIAKKVPKIILIDPNVAPRIIPYNGANMSAVEKEAPGIPISGNVGIIRKNAYITENEAIIATFLFLFCFIT